MAGPMVTWAPQWPLSCSTERLVALSSTQIQRTAAWSNVVPEPRHLGQSVRPSKARLAPS